MHFYQIASGGDRNFSYLIGCPDQGLAAVLDPSPDPNPVSEKARSLGLEVRFVVNTHSHFDHSSGNSRFLDAGTGRLIAYKTNPAADIAVDDGHTVALGSLMLKILHTPGHTEDSICVSVNNELLTGDTLFVGKIGGTSDRESAHREFESLRRLMKLPGETRIWPGHDVGLKPSSTIQWERKTNPFCERLDDFDAFLWLKQNWADYKREHNIP